MNAVTATADGEGGQAARTRTPLLELGGIDKSFGNIRALSGIGLKVHAGEVTCILGDNGAGKSTLIKIIAGLYAPDAGQYLIDGEEVSLSSPVRPWTVVWPPSTRTWRWCR